MNGMWSEAKTPDGKSYYHNSQTNETTWTKPEAMMTPLERVLANQPWKETTDASGRKYWYHNDTKVSSWEMPEDYKTALALAQSSLPPPFVPPPTFVAGGAPLMQRQTSRPSAQPMERRVSQPRDRDRYARHDRGDRWERDRHNHSDNLRANFVQATANEPDYATYEEAEAAFMKMLKRFNVQAGWTWDQTMRAVIKDPQYRAIKDPKARKDAFEKYVIESRAQEKERAKERMAKLRQDFGTMLRSHPEIKHYTRWETARAIIEGETIFKSARDEAERRQLYDEYKIQLKKSHAENEVASRKVAWDAIVLLLKDLNLEPYTKWTDAQKLISSSERFRTDDKFEPLTKSDVLLAFDDHMKFLDREFNTQRQGEMTQKARRERQNRDAFIALLSDLRSSGKIAAGGKWMNIFPLIKDDSRYLSMLGQSGSTALDLFWDVVEEEERAFRVKRNEVLDVLDDQRFEITVKTTLEEFLSIMEKDRRTNTIKPEDLRLIFSRLHQKITMRNEEEKHQAERTKRRAIDALRSRIKHLVPPIRITDTWDKVRPKVEHYEEYRALSSEDDRRSAFDKVIDRLREKERDAEHLAEARRADRQEREKRSGGYRERDRERENEREREHLARRRPGTPEHDVYEEERKRAMANRERQYRKSSGAGLSPAPSDGSRRRDTRNYEQRSRYERRDRNDDRDHDRERRERSGRLEGPYAYDRERRGSEMRRERPYVSRADPRETGAKALDYGESGRAGSMSKSSSVVVGDRRKRSNVSEDNPVSKRVRGDRRSKTPHEMAAAKVEEEEEALKSGSEEGEIEEG